MSIKHVVMGAMLLSIANLSFAGIRRVGLDIFKEKTPYEKSGIGVEIINKNPNPVFVLLRVGNEVFVGEKGEIVFRIDGQTKKALVGHRFLTDISKPTTIALWYPDDPGKVIATTDFLKKQGSIGTETFHPAPTKVYLITPHKTAYLTFDDKNNLRPQTGPVFGWAGKTESGLSLEKNVDKDDVAEIKGFKTPGKFQENILYSTPQVPKG